MVVNSMVFWDEAMQAARPEGEDNRMPDQETVPDPVIRDFVVLAGLVQGDPSPHFTALTGGVASDIWKVETPERTFVVKKALSRLRVAREWTAPVSRNASEVDWLVTAGAIVPDAVPRVLAHDEQAGAFAMEFLDPAEYPVWKAELRAGSANPAFAAQVGKALAAIHNATAGDEMVARRFANDAIFHAIRLEPYLEATARAHPDLADRSWRCRATPLATKRALVHGDVSPKNILVGPDGPVFLDAECAWYGDPAFDLAFCLNHLLLKMPVGTSRPRTRFAPASTRWRRRLSRTRASWEPLRGHRSARGDAAARPAARARRRQVAGRIPDRTRPTRRASDGRPRR